MASQEKRPTPRPLRSMWHEGFAYLMTEQAPATFAVSSEVTLPRHPRRADLVLIRRSGGRDDRGQVLRSLWPLIERVALCELKSPSDGFRRGGLIQLVGYGIDYHLMQQDAARRGREPSLEHADELSLVLIVPSISGALEAEIEELGLEWQLLPSSGYVRLHGAVYTIYVVSTDEVSLAENDEELMVFSRRPVSSEVASRWLEWLQPYRWRNPQMPHARYDRKSTEEMMTKLLSSLPLEKRLQLTGLSPEAVLRGLSLEERMMALPDDMLAGLSASYVESLPEHVQQLIRTRLARTQ